MIRAWWALIRARYMLKSRNLEQLLPMLEKRKSKCDQELNEEEAKKVLYQIQQAKRFLLWRNACLEESLALFLLATAQKKSVGWCIGSRLAPFASHAWVEVEQKALGENVSVYQKMIQV